MRQGNATVESNFTGGLKTEYTGLNFPENACTDTDNCVFTLIGTVLRRAGIDFEDHYVSQAITRTGNAISYYKWNNVGGDGLTQIIVVQAGRTIYFFRSTDATDTNPLSATLLGSTVGLLPFWTGVGNLDQTECQFADGNGYLFIFNPYMNPVYCVYNAGTITANSIGIKIRDFNGILETGIPTNNRPGSLTAEHNYNLFNQGWSTAPAWNAFSNTTNQSTTGSKTFNLAVLTGVTPANGQQVRIASFPDNGLTCTLVGTVTAYSSPVVTINVTLAAPPTGVTVTQWTLNPINVGLLTTWNTAEGNYPSNADVWWRFKNTSDVFDPATTAANVTLGTGPAPNGFYILDAFNQDRSAISGLSGITAISTTVRPRTGTWFQGRIWYAGIDSSQQATGDASYYTWTENLYFSQTVTDLSQFGMCYQNNDPTSEDLFDLLPTDGGVITIQGCGSIYKLFPVQNGLLVFAANGIWFITGSQGIGFAANDYTITKISAIQALSHTSFVDVLGWPVFWNEEGIYTVNPSPQGGGLVVTNLCYGTILSFYSEIPITSKKYARGAYNPIDFVITWVYSSVAPTDVNTQHIFDKVLSFNTSNKAFYPYTVTGTSPVISGMIYVNSPGGSNAPDPVFKYLTFIDNTHLTFSEEKDQTTWRDFFSYDNVGVDYDSYFVTGFKLHGKGITKWQPIYVQMFSNAQVPTAYKIQGIWDYANSPNSGKYTTIQRVINGLSRFGIIYRRHKIRGNGVSLQFKVQSVSGFPFDIIGWAGTEAISTVM